MGRKGENTKQNIAAEARRLFAKNGFDKVTMQDICEATGLSRGGLYRHFDSTAEIFTCIISTENERNHHALDEAVAEGIGAKAIFERFIDSRMESILTPEFNIYNALHEFASAEESGMQLMRDYISESIDVLSAIISRGNSEGVFSCSDPVTAAKNILWLVEGMGIHASILPLTKKEADEQKKEIFAHLGYNI